MDDSTQGKIHSLESFGTVDGPGIRFVVFMQGCPLRCLYCHNPDTWNTDGASRYVMTPGELTAEVVRYKNFIAKGGVTVTGGEPLLQPAFVKEFFRLCQLEGIHTALDTSGCIYSSKALDVLEYTDLVLLDIKTIDTSLHRTLTDAESANTLKFLNYLDEKKIPTWIRHVLVPGMTDDDSRLETLARFLTQYTCIEKVELLAYHIMGTYKYEELGIPYPLKDTLPLSEERLTNAKKIFGRYGLPL